MGESGEGGGNNGRMNFKDNFVVVVHESNTCVQATPASGLASDLRR